MSYVIITFTLVVFCLTVLFIIMRPKGMNVSIPTSVGAALFFIMGVVQLSDIYQIINIISGAAITILSTIIMSIVLESFHFFRWAAYQLAKKAKGSGIALFWYLNLLCFSMTLFFNNDGSILITTPIILYTLNYLQLKPHEKVPYLFTGAILATVASAPIGVSNLANLIALKIVGLDLNTYATLMFVPSMLGICVIAGGLFLYFKKDIKKKVPLVKVPLLGNEKNYHPLIGNPLEEIKMDWAALKICLLIVVLIRISFFLLAPYGISTEWPALFGALLLALIRWYRNKSGIKDLLKKTPWDILIFAFGMYVIVFGIHNTGFTTWIVEGLGSLIASNNFNAIFIMGILLTVMSNLFNNLPAVMIGTLTLTDMNLSNSTLQVAYLANVIGSDIGSLLLPMGTLATLIWMRLLKINHVHLSWARYFRIAFLVIPLGLVVSLIALYYWTTWLFHL